jgi:hypothetical protein
VTSFHHQPEAQHPKSSAIHKPQADYPIFWGERTSRRHAVMSAYDPIRKSSTRQARRWDDHVHIALRAPDGFRDAVDILELGQVRWDGGDVVSFTSRRMPSPMPLFPPVTTATLPPNFDMLCPPFCVPRLVRRRLRARALVRPNSERAVLVGRNGQSVAIASPMPRLAPVTRATLPVRSVSINVSRK